jgi:hypothetical protein
MKDKNVLIIIVWVHKSHQNGHHSHSVFIVKVYNHTSDQIQNNFTLKFSNHLPSHYVIMLSIKNTLSNNLVVSLA